MINVSFSVIFRSEPVQGRHHVHTRPQCCVALHNTASSRVPAGSGGSRSGCIGAERPGSRRGHPGEQGVAGEKSSKQHQGLTAMLPQLSGVYSVAVSASTPFTCFLLELLLSSPVFYSNFYSLYLFSTHFNCFYSNFYSGQMASLIASSLRSCC